MDLNAVKMFVMVARYGSLSAASRKYTMPLLTLSRKIGDLEKPLGVMLLERTAKGCKVIEAGARLLEHASTAMDMLYEAERSVLPEHSPLTGWLRLSLPHTIFRSLVGNYQAVSAGLSRYSSECVCNRKKVGPRFRGI